jgi:rare lipoprotein A
VEEQSNQVGRMFLLVLGIGLALGTGCASTPPSHHRSGGTTTTAEVRPAVGVASYYGKQFHGRNTASGEKYNMNALTAAHRSFPFGTQVKVTNLANDRSVMVRVNDRGPFIRGRIMDVSLEAARRLQMIGAGTARVRLEPAPTQLVTGTDPR